MRTAILASGGMDSFLTWFLFEPAARNVFVDLGQPYLPKERCALQNLSKLVDGFSFVEVQGPDWSPHELLSGIIPMRNAMLVLMAAQYAEDIVLGVLEGEVNSDKSPEFMQAISAVMSISGRGQYWNDNIGTAYQVRTPIASFSKTELVKKFLQERGPVNALLATVSCYSGEGGKQCGNCPSCFKRWVALTNCVLRDDFDQDPVEYGLKRDYHLGTKHIARSNPAWGIKRCSEIATAMGSSDVG